MRTGTKALPYIFRVLIQSIKELFASTDMFIETLIQPFHFIRTGQETDSIFNSTGQGGAGSGVSTPPCLSPLGAAAGKGLKGNEKMQQYPLTIP
jgi:hypothetical protein